MKNKKLIIKISLALIACLVAAFFIINYIVWSGYYRGKIYNQTSIAGIDVSGKTAEQAQELLLEKTNKISTSGLSFQYGEKSATLESSPVSLDAGLSYPALVFDMDKTLTEALKEDKGESFWRFLSNVIRPGWNKIDISYQLDEEQIKSFLGENFPELNIDPENAYFSFAEDGQELALKNNPEKIGKEINYDQIISLVRDNIKNLSDQPVNIKTRSKYPTVKSEDLSGLEEEAKKMFKQADITLEIPPDEITVSNKKSWVIKSSQLITWASAKKSDRGLTISLDEEKIKNYIRLSISAEIDEEPIRPRFEIKDGRVSSWQASRAGKAVDVEATAKNVIDGFLGNQKTIAIVTKMVGAEDLTAENSFNIKEILGTGHSAFTGSPANRRHNISVGSAALHGLLIKPGEEFSLVSALGDISDKTGYLPELVIKGNKTVPEFGGGLCQVGTTLFRTVLSAGLPVTMRQNHSYRVSYYEPAGTDATIYTPQPDFRFINDTKNYILIQARSGKNDLYFDFWGVKDGRIATTTYPVIYNIVKPEPTKIIETDELKPGEKKCTESSHNGADAYFDYKVIYPEESGVNPLIQERRFKSHYIPWQAVCLIGKSATSSPSNATSTPIATSSAPAISTSTDDLIKKEAAEIPATSNNIITP